MSDGKLPEQEPEKSARPIRGVLSLTIKDKTVLYAAYMPFVRDGGLFIPTPRNFSLGEEVSMLLNLMDEKEKLPLKGKIVWITPKGSQGNRAPGIGVEFIGDEGKIVRSKIENYLATLMKSEKPTHTL